MSVQAIGSRGVIAEELPDIITTYASGEGEMAQDTGRRNSPTHDEIAQLDFSLYESRGRQNGHDVEDWLQAERDLVRHYS